jgi:hypothetical protein
MFIASRDVEALNLFKSLFDRRPRAAVRPGENFLTEAIVYMLRTNEDFQARFIRLVTNPSGAAPSPRSSASRRRRRLAPAGEGGRGAE